MKLVREHINEKFTDESDPIQDMGIGMIQKIKDWLNHITRIYGHYNIVDYKINNDGTINADRVDISYPEITTLPEYIKFNVITTDFCCCFKSIETIQKNGPKYVGGNYKIYQKRITIKEQDVRNICIIKRNVIIKRES